MSYTIKTFVEGPVDANNYLVINDNTKEAVLIDCSAYSQAIIDTVKELGVNVTDILLTHGHFDHILGVNAMKKALGAKSCSSCSSCSSQADTDEHLPAVRVWIHKDDLEWVEHINAALGRYGMPKVETPQIDATLDENAPVEFIHTPGHTRGGVCYMIDGNLFSGDTLFYETVGRTDLPGGDFKVLKNSIETLFKLDDKTVVYPGHGQPTTIGHEKLHNEVISL